MGRRFPFPFWPWEVFPFPFPRPPISYPASAGFIGMARYGIPIFQISKCPGSRFPKFQISKFTKFQMQNVQELPMKPILRIKKIKELHHRGCRTSHQLQIENGRPLCNKYMMRMSIGAGSRYLALCDVRHAEIGLLFFLQNSSERL